MTQQRTLETRKKLERSLVHSLQREHGAVDTSVWEAPSRTEQAHSSAVLHHSSVALCYTGALGLAEQKGGTQLLQLHEQQETML